MVPHGGCCARLARRALVRRVLARLVAHKHQVALARSAQMKGTGHMGTNAYAAILAGGSGTRMGTAERPKQFLMLGEKPIIVHTTEKFMLSGLFDAVVVLTPDTWIQQTRDLFRKYAPALASEVRIVAGGATRNDTVANGVAYIRDNFETNDDTILVTHDAVRPFVSHRIIAENVQAARQTGACDTVIPATDTIVESADGTLISNIPDRSKLYQGQTPQSFNLAKLEQLMGSLTPEEAAVLTDACKIFVLRGQPVALVEGDSVNMKITFPQDMRLANALLGELDA